MTEVVSYQRYAMQEARERAVHLGCGALSSSELVALTIGTPHSIEPFKVTERLLSVHEGINGISRASLTDLVEVHGVGLAKAIQIRSSLELGRRLVVGYPLNRQQIKTPAEMANVLVPKIGHLEQEEVHSVSLDTRNRIIGTEMIYRGSLNAANMRICEVFRQAIRNNAASVIIAHNHPSGDPSPSADDVQVTRELVKAGKLLDIEILDHLVIGRSTYTSLKERGLGFD